MNQLPTPVRLRQGESVSLVTGQVSVAPANRVRYIDRGPWYGLDDGDLNILARYFRCAIIAQEDAWLDRTFPPVS